MPPLKSLSIPVIASFGVLTLHALAAPTKVIDVTKEGVSADGTTLNTAKIQKLIDDCSSSGGGTLVFPKGNYLTGTIQIKDNVTLRLERNATLLGSTEPADYQNLDPFIDGTGNPLGHALVVAIDASHVGIEGSGTIDGQSPKLHAKEHPYVMRPFLVRWVRCNDVTVKDLHLTNPGARTLNFSQTNRAVIEGITIRSRDLGMANNDGIDLDSSANIQIRHCDINSGDDALVIKATSTKPSRDIVASDCKLSTWANAIKLGTESIGDFANITVSNCQITNTRLAGIALYSVDGGELHDISISDVTMDGVALPISIRLGSRLKTFRKGEQPRPSAGALHDVSIKNIAAKNIQTIGMLINGVPGYSVKSVTLDNITLEVPGGGDAAAANVQLPEKEKAYPECSMFGKTFPAYGIYARHVSDISLNHITIQPTKADARPQVVFVDVQNVRPTDFASTRKAP